MNKLFFNINSFLNSEFYIPFFLAIIASYHIVYGLVYNLFWIFFIAIFFLSLYCKRIQTNNLVIAWIILIAWSTIGILYTNDYLYSIGFILKIAIFVFSLCVATKTEYLESSFTLIKVACLIYILAIVVEIGSPDFVNRIRMFFVSDINTMDRIDYAIEMRSTRYGLFADPAVSAFFCGTGIAIGYSYYYKKKKLLSFLWTITSVICVVLTNKRGAIISTVATALSIYLITAGNATVVLMRIFKSAAILSIAVLILLNSPVAMEYIDKMNNVYSNYNRVELYSMQYKMIKDSPLVGNGTKSTRKQLDGTEGHNIYIAKINENGILGLILLLWVFAFGILKTKKVFIHICQDQCIAPLLSFSLFMQFFFMYYGLTENTTTNIYSQAMYFYCLGLTLKIEDSLSNKAELSCN